MLDVRAFLSVIVLSAATTGAAHAVTPRSTPVSQPAVVATTAPQTSAGGPSDAAGRAWGQVISSYRVLFGLSGMRVVIFPDPTIEGIQDGPDGVDPLGIKGIKGLTPKYQQDQTDPTVPAF